MFSPNRFTELEVFLLYSGTLEKDTDLKFEIQICRYWKCVALSISYPLWRKSWTLSKSISDTNTSEAV